MNDRRMIEQEIARAIHAIGSELDLLERWPDRITIGDSDDLAAVFMRFGSLMARLLEGKRNAA